MVTRRHARLTTARKGARPTTGDGSGAVTPERRDAFVSRTSTAILLAGLFGAVIVGKVTYEAAIVRDSRMQLAHRIQRSGEPLEGEPGPIYSREGEVLAKSVVRYAICANPASYDSDAQREDTARQLAEVTGVPYSRIIGRLSRSERSFCYIMRQASTDIEEEIADRALHGVFTLNEIGRVYPFGPLAANAVGLRGDDCKGLMGIELLWGFCLDGSESSKRTNFDRFGRTILGPGSQFIPEQAGRRLVLTIRMPLQQVVEAAMDEVWERNQPESATCTVIDVKTGDIVALSARPNFDPNDTSTAKPERTRCAQVADVYAPGSTMKTAIVAAALDAGVITPQSRFFCTGTTTIGNRPLGCWGDYRIKGHGSLTPEGVITGSCNISAAKIALLLGKERLYECLYKMRITDTLSSGLFGEQPGRVLPASMQRKRGIANIGFGQGIDVTDLHMLAIYAAVANDGMMLYPNIVKEVRGEDGTLIRRRQPSEAGRLYGPGASREMLKYLESNVERGTGHSAKIEGVRVGGKTGTAQIFDQKTQRFLASEYVMSFAAVAPIEDPQFVVLVRVSRPKHGQHASDTAAPAARRALDAALRMADDAPADETEVTPA